MSTAPAYAPDVRLTFDGRPAPEALRASVTAVSCRTGFEGIDRLEVTLANEALRWLDAPMLALDTEVSLAIGYSPDPPDQLFVGDIVGTEATFPGEGMPTITVVAHDRRQRLADVSPVRWFGVPVPTLGVMPIPDLAVAPALIAEHGLMPRLDPMGAFLSVLLGAIDAAASIDDPTMRQRVVRRQHSETTLALLERIAVENGWELVVEHGAGADGQVLRLLSPAAFLDPDVTVRWGHSLLDFAPKESKVGQVAAVSVRVWRPEIKLELTVTIGFDWDRQSIELSITPGFGLPGSDGPSTTTMLVQEPVTLATAPRIIVSKLLPRLNRRLTAKGSCVGNPAIRTGRVLRVEGVGERFGGLYRISGTHHQLDSSGYRTSFDLRKEIWFGSIPPASQGAVRINGMRAVPAHL